MKDNDNVEVLLLLVCLVGVVAFLAFSLATLNLGAAIEERNEELPDVESLIQQRQGLAVTKEQLQNQGKALQAKVDYLRGKISAEEKKIASLQKELPDHTLAEDIARLRKELADLEQRKVQLAQDRKDLNVFRWRDFKGATTLTNPLFLDCQSNAAIIYPGKKALRLSDLNKKEALKDIVSGHDGIVLLVRPDGFKTFAAAFEKAKKTGLTLAYEPVNAEWQLELAY
ncbi:MAG TPA: hypothetical protein DCY27_06550 [Desulfobacterales bacterium]|nr:hypothetical protein [Desulfobacterales bacterium]